VGELNAGSRTILMHKFNNPLERRDLRIFPQAHVAGADTAFRGNSGCFDNDQACSAHCTAAQVDQVPVRGKAILAGVLAHGRNRDAIGEGDTALGQRRE
jgi:hypothetical protein